MRPSPRSVAVWCLAEAREARRWLAMMLEARRRACSAPPYSWNGDAAERDARSQWLCAWRNARAVRAGYSPLPWPVLP